EERLLVRTPFRVDLIGLANAWQQGPVKALPDGFRLTGAALRMWALAAGRPDEQSYLLSVDEEAPETHTPLADAFCRLGLAVKLVGAAQGSSAIRVTGRRRLDTLAELLGTPPPAAAAAWPVQAGIGMGRPSAEGFGSRQSRRVRSSRLPGPTHATIW